MITRTTLSKFAAEQLIGCIILSPLYCGQPCSILYNWNTYRGLNSSSCINGFDSLSKRTISCVANKAVRINFMFLGRNGEEIS